MPALSVIVPVYNVEDCLDQCLESLLAQTFKDFEIVCVNDGSTDGSAEVLAACAVRDSRIRIVTKPNGGLSSARNAGMKIAAAPVVSFLDSDDTYTADACGEIVRAFEDPDVDVLTFGANCIPEEGVDPWLVQHLSPRDAVYAGFSPDLAFREMSCPFAWRTACRRSFLEENGICFDGSVKFGEDQVFHAAVYPRSRKTVLSSRKLYNYRISRNGSLMHGFSQDMHAKLAEHVKIADVVLREWERSGVLAGCSEDVLNWFFGFVLEGALALPEPQAQSIFELAGSLLGEYWAPAEIKAAALPDTVCAPLLACASGRSARMDELKQTQSVGRKEKLLAKPLDSARTCVPGGKVKVLGACRGDGKLYAKIQLPMSVDPGNVLARLVCGQACFPTNVYPLGGADGFSRIFVAELPIPDYLAAIVQVEAGGERVGSFAVNFERAKWASRLNYRTRKDLCSQIRDYERGFTDQQYQVRVMRFLEGGQGIVWRIEVSWQGDAEEKPIIQAVDGKGNWFSPRAHFFEFQKATDSANASSEAHRLFLSVELPEQMQHFVLTAKSPNPGTGMKPGFASINPAAYEGFKYASWKHMKDAKADATEYKTWYLKHRADEKLLAEQAQHAFERNPLVSVVVPCYNSDEGFLEAMVRSVRKQSYANWELLLVDASSEKPTVKHVVEAASDSRIKRIPVQENLGIVGNTNIGIEAACGEYIAFLDHDDLLEPDALYEYAKAIDANPEIGLLYCDEDYFQQEGSYHDPNIKSQCLNLDLLYSHNCITHFLMVKRSLLQEIGLSSPDVSGAQDYDLALRAVAAGAEVHHVCRVLYHWRMHPGSTAGDGEGGKPYAEEAGRLALQRHFEQRGIAGRVVTTASPYVYRMLYELPSPHPLVSIVIPSKDHADMLASCIGSILREATYPNYEIVVIENNSTEPSTFAYYERIQEQDSHVKVVRWEHEFNYSKIVNFGAAKAKGEYLLFLNNDTEVISPDFIETMMGYLQRPEVGVVGAKLYFRDGLTQHAGILVGPHGAIAHANQDFPANRGGYCGRAVRPGNFSAVTGACQMTTHSLFEKVGGYDEALAVGFNDADFCLRLGRMGYLTVFTPYAELYHYEFVSRGREEADSAKRQRWERERDLFTERWNEIFEKGDPYSSPNFDRNSAYFALGE